MSLSLSEFINETDRLLNGTESEDFRVHFCKKPKWMTSYSGSKAFYNHATRGECPHDHYELSKENLEETITFLQDSHAFEDCKFRKSRGDRGTHHDYPTTSSPPHTMTSQTESRAQTAGNGNINSDPSSVYPVESPVVSPAKSLFESSLESPSVLPAEPSFELPPVLPSETGS